jgi:hypothetical protein
MDDLIKAVSDGIAAGKSKAELVKSVRLEKYSKLLEYEMSRASNVDGAYEMLTARRGR